MTLRIYRIDDGETHWYAAETRAEAIDLHYAWMEPERNLADWDIRELDPDEPLTVRVDGSRKAGVGYPLGSSLGRGGFTATAQAWAEWAGRPTQVSSTCF